MTKRNMVGSDNFEPALSHADLAAIECRETGTGQWAVARRVSMAVLTRSAAELRTSWADPDGQAALLDALEVSTSWLEHVKLTQELAEAAVARLLLTGEAAGKRARLVP